MSSRPADRDALRAHLLRQIPRWYSPLAHVAFPSLFGLSVIALCLWALRHPSPLELLAVPFTLVLSNAAEWRIHRDLLHRRTWPMQILYDRHTPQHHRLFIAGEMAIRSPRELRLVLIPFYGVVAAMALDGVLAALVWLAGERNVAALFLATAVAYLLAYEWLHLAYHLPPTSFIGRRGLVARLRRHHSIHHAPDLMQRWNFNVTVPLWDAVAGTVYRGRPRVPGLDGSREGG